MLQPFLQPQQPPQRTILSVSQLNRQCKALLESTIGSVWLTGEISNLTKAASGHYYFSLKDDNAQIRCAMFKGKAQRLTFVLNEGDKVVVKGKVSLFEARGDYQLICDYMEPGGQGDLQRQLNQLIVRLQQEGLFAQERKKKLPYLPKRIGIITSPSGAAIHDALTVLQRRCPMIPVIIYPSQVQGNKAAEELITAIETAEARDECDVLLLTRGGGSLEDLWCFNNESLARRIAQMKIPIVAAVGHEVDTTVVELVADLRAATPSAAAELVAPEQTALQQQIDLVSANLSGKILDKLKQYQIQLNIAHLKLSDPASAIAASQQRLDGVKQKLGLFSQRQSTQKQHRLDRLIDKLDSLNPVVRLNNARQILDLLDAKLKASWQHTLEKARHHLHLKARTLNTLSPLSTLERGYTITRDQQTGTLISQVDKLKEGQKITCVFHDGSADAKITQVKPAP